MKMIVNVNPQWGIGRDGKLLCQFKEDMMRFKNYTAGKVIVYGRKTLESFPNQEPLPGRVNIVVSSSKNNIPESAKRGCDYYASMKLYKKSKTASLKFCLEGPDIILTGVTINHKDAMFPEEPTTLIYTDDIHLVEHIGLFLGHKSDDIIVCGGEQIYRQMLPLCDTVYVTKNDNVETEPDAFFPNLDEHPDWEPTVHYGHTFTEEGLGYEFLTYSRKL